MMWVLLIVLLVRLTDFSQHKKSSKLDKCDDEDGHYIVTPEADLTERCKWFHKFMWQNPAD